MGKNNTTQKLLFKGENFSHKTDFWGKINIYTNLQLERKIRKQENKKMKQEKKRNHTLFQSENAFSKDEQTLIE